MIRQFSWVVGLAVLVHLPAVLLVARQSSTPWWYQVLAALATSLGAALIAIGLGAVALFAARSRKNRLQIALTATFLAALFTAYSFATIPR